MRQRAMHESKRHAGVGGMNDRPLPFHQHDIRRLRGLDRERLGGASDEISNNGVDRNAPPLHENAGLTRGGKIHAMSKLPHRRLHLQLRGHLPDVAVGTDGQHNRGV